MSLLQTPASMVNGNLEECLRFKQSFALVDISLRSMCGTWTTSTICNYNVDQMHLRQLPGTSLMQQFDASVGAFFFSSETPDCGYDTRNGFTTMPAAFAFGTVRGSQSRSTGKERDTESGNDYFGARYYSSAMGRFMSPDWSAQAEPVPYANLDNPQSLNLYAYVGNNPLGRVDANGHCWGWIQWACNAAQSLKNGFTPNGGGFHTDATVKKEAARQRQWLLDQGLNTDQGHIVQNASDKDIRGMYGCFHNPRCMSAIANILATTVTQFGYPGQKGYNDAKNQLNKANTPEGTINNQTLGPNGKIPTQSEAIQMIEESGGKVERIEAGHGPDSVSTHDYPHINYTTESGVKGTIQIQP